MPQISDKYRKDFKNRSYENPRVVRDERRRKCKSAKLVAILSVIVVVGVLYVILFSSLFVIKSVTVVGLNKIKPENINSIIDNYRSGRKWFVFSHNNLWVFSRTELEKKIEQDYYLEKFIVKKKLSGNIVITIAERGAVVNWLTNNLCYQLDGVGTVIGYCDSGDCLPRVKDQHDVTVAVGQQALDADTLKFIVDLNGQVLEVLNGRLKPAEYDKDGPSLTLKTLEGVDIIFNINLPAMDQASRLAVLLAQSDLKNNLSKTSYIDLRFGEKVYYK